MKKNYELFLYSKGYYLEWMRTNWFKEKDIPKLRRMMTGHSGFWREMASEFKSVEADLEADFWNSQFEIIQ